MTTFEPCLWSIGHSERERLQIVLLSKPADLVREGLDWVSAEASIQAGGFRGHSPLYLTRGDLDTFLAEAERLYAELSGSATFRTIEEQLEFTVQANALGQLTTHGYLMDSAGTGNKLAFHLALDQSLLKRTITELRSALKALSNT
jgi:hypothetical protein